MPGGSQPSSAPVSLRENTAEWVSSGGSSPNDQQAADIRPVTPPGWPADAHGQMQERTAMNHDHLQVVSTQAHNPHNPQQVMSPIRHRGDRTLTREEIQ